MTVYDRIKELGVFEGWSPIFGGCIVYLDEVYGKIIISDGHDRMVLNKDGAYNTNGECLIFPSRITARKIRENSTDYWGS